MNNRIVTASLKLDYFSLKAVPHLTTNVDGFLSERHLLRNSRKLNDDNNNRADVYCTWVSMIKYKGRLI